MEMKASAAGKGKDRFDDPCACVFKASLSAIAMTLFATGIALSLLLIAAYSRPFTGEISVRPDLLKQVITSGPKGAGNSH